LPDTGDDARLRAAAAMRTVCGRAADGLLAEDVFARRAGRHAQLLVEHVRRGDDDDVDLVAVDHLPPVLRRRREPERLGGLLPPDHDVVGADGEAGLVRAVGEQRGEAEVGPAVGLAHPAEPDDAETDRAPHGRNTSGLTTTAVSEPTAPASTPRALSMACS
jgi:hypothetical protein